MANLVYCHASDNLIAGVVPSVNTGTVLTAYPATNATDGAPAVPTKFSTTSGSLVFNLGTAQRVDLVAVVGHNIDATLTIQGHTSNAWTSPAVSVVLPVTTIEGDGSRPNRWVDLTAVLSAGARTLQYWRLLIATNPTGPSLGEVWLAGTKRQLATNISWGFAERDAMPDVVHETDAGVRFAYSHGVRVRRLDAELDATDAVSTALRAWWLNARGRSRSFLVLPDGDTGEILQVRFAEAELPQQRVFLDRRVQPLMLEELSRGVVV